MRELAEFPVDPILQEPSVSPAPTSVSITSNIDGYPSDDDSSSSQDRQAPEDGADAVVIKIQSKITSKKD